MIGILTFHHVYNYGALLQAYALQKYLSRYLEKESYIIDVRPFKRGRPNEERQGRIERLLRLRPALIKDVNIQRKVDRFDDFRDNYLNVSDLISNVRKVSSDKVKEIEAIIVGSDQVWNSRYGKRSLDTYFLKGVPEKIKRISYAACAGTPQIGVASYGRYKRQMALFESIGVRDEFTEKMVNDIAGLETHLVVDPTLLIDWKEELDLSASVDIPDKYIFQYGRTTQGDKVAKYLSAHYKIPVVSVGMENDAGHENFNMKDLGPLEWIKVIKNSSFVITKSFHGLMFALNFRKPFLVTPSNLNSSYRLLDACKRYQVSDAVLQGEESEMEIMEKVKSINNSNYDKFIESHISISKDFLQKSLRSV